MRRPPLQPIWFKVLAKIVTVKKLARFRNLPTLLNLLTSPDSDPGKVGEVGRRPNMPKRHARTTITGYTSSSAPGPSAHSAAAAPHAHAPRRAPGPVQTTYQYGTGSHPLGTAPAPLGTGSENRSGTPAGVRGPPAPVLPQQEPEDRPLQVGSPGCVATLCRSGSKMGPFKFPLCISEYTAVGVSRRRPKWSHCLHPDSRTVKKSGTRCLNPKHPPDVWFRRVALAPPDPPDPPTAPALAR